MPFWPRLMFHFRSPQVEKIMLFDHFAQRPNKNKCMTAVSDLRLRERLFILVQLPGPSHNDHAANLTMHVVPSSQSAISFVKPPDHGQSRNGKSREWRAIFLCTAFDQKRCWYWVYRFYPFQIVSERFRLCGKPFLSARLGNYVSSCVRESDKIRRCVLRSRLHLSTCLPKIPSLFIMCTHTHIVMHGLEYLWKDVYSITLAKRLLQAGATNRVCLWAKISRRCSTTSTFGVFLWVGFWPPWHRSWACSCSGPFTPSET